MSELVKLTYYLGIKVEQGNGFIEMKQTGYAKKILEKVGLVGCNSTKYLIDPKEQLTKNEGGKLVDATQYKSMVGGMCYFVRTRPDIAYVVGIVRRYMEKPTTLHLNTVKRILRYINGALNFGLVYSRKGSNNILTGSSDSDSETEVCGVIFL